MKTDERPLANPVVVLREEFDDWALLFNPDTANAIGINPVGVAIWKRLNGKLDLAEIAAEISEGFSDVPEDVSGQVSTFVNDLIRDGFVCTELEGNNS